MSLFCVVLILIITLDDKCDKKKKKNEKLGVCLTDIVSVVSYWLWMKCMRTRCECMRLHSHTHRHTEWTNCLNILSTHILWLRFHDKWFSLNMLLESYQMGMNRPECSKNYSRIERYIRRMPDFKRTCDDVGNSGAHTRSIHALFTLAIHLCCAVHRKALGVYFVFVLIGFGIASPHSKCCLQSRSWSVYHLFPDNF